MEQTLPFATPVTDPGQKPSSNKPLAVVTIPAIVLEAPRIKKINGDELFETYCAVKTNYRPFNTSIYSKLKPEVNVGDEIEIELTSYQYKLRFKKTQD